MKVLLTCEDRFGCLFQMMSARKQMDVVMCAGEQEAILRACRKLRPDFVVLESDIPNLDVPCTIKDLKSLLDSVIILVLEGKNNTLKELEILEAGAMGWIARPISAFALADIIEGLALYHL